MIQYDNVSSVFTPFVKDAFGIVRRGFSPEAAQLSAKLCADTYEMNLTPWISNRWMDITIQTDGRLTALGEDEGGVFSRIGDKLKLMRIKGRMSQKNAAAQLGIAVEQLEESRAGNVIVMMHPMENGKFAVAVSFMGTGRRAADWMPNLRVSCEDGFHQGFLQLSRLFESNESGIMFPRTAKMLGMDSLSLQDVLREMRRPDSRFVLWVTGHSLGGALTQVYVYHKIAEDDVLPENIQGYCFASPAAAKIERVENPGSFPIYHIQNSDDVIPRVGAQVHIGECLRFNANEEMRRKCYAWSYGENSCRYRKIVKPFVEGISDMSSCLTFVSAYLAVLSTRPHDEIAEHVSMFTQGFGDGVKKLLDNADQSVEKLLNITLGKVDEAHADIYGTSMSREKLEQLSAALSNAADETGLLRLTEAISSMVNEAHRINRRKDTELDCAYAYIAAHSGDDGALVPGIWVNRGGVPWQVWNESTSLEQRKNPGHRKNPERRKIPGKLRGYSASRQKTQADEYHTRDIPFVKGNLQNE